LLVAPDAAQRETVRRRSGAFPGSEFEMVPGLRRIMSLALMLRCARDKVSSK